MELKSELSASAKLRAPLRSFCPETTICPCFTAQHLVSAVADIVSGADTLSWELRVPTPDGASDSVSVELDTAEVTAAQARPLPLHYLGIIP